MGHNISILFYTRNRSKKENEQLPIYLRISINGKRIVQTTNRHVERSKWSASLGRMKGAFAEAKALNNFLDVLKSKVYATEREMVLDGKEITFQSFRDKWFGVDKPKRMILQKFRSRHVGAL
jgi:hypothetical protein